MPTPVNCSTAPKRLGSTSSSPRTPRAWKAFWLRSLMESGNDYLDNIWHTTHVLRQRLSAQGDLLMLALDRATVEKWQTKSDAPEPNSEPKFSSSGLRIIGIPRMF